MIFAGQPIKIIGVPYAARHSLTEMRASCRHGEAEFVDMVWSMREPVVVRANPKQIWPIMKASDLVQANVERLTAKKGRG